MLIASYFARCLNIIIRTMRRTADIYRYTALATSETPRIASMQGKVIYSSGYRWLHGYLSTTALNTMLWVMWGNVCPRDSWRIDRISELNRCDDYECLNHTWACHWRFEGGVRSRLRSHSLIETGDGFETRLYDQQLGHECSATILTRSWW